ncbi:hypothetical protein ScPMuIL_018676 [Solemya velum]
MSVSSEADRSVAMALPGDEEDRDLVQQELYETQHFGFTSKSFVNGVYNAIIEYLQEGLSYVQQFIAQEFESVMPSDKVQISIDAMIPYFVMKLERSFDVLERYLMKNVFCIPPDVVLPEDKVQLNQRYTPQDEMDLDRQVTQLKDNILAVKYANARLRHELSVLEGVQTRMDCALRQLEELKAVRISTQVPVQRQDMEAIVVLIKDLMQTVLELEVITPTKKSKLVNS